jgi:DNA-binding CsgD family transcriptional regulator
VSDLDVNLVGREHELAVLQSFLQPRAEPRVLVIEGDAGIGKTTLWEAGVRLAADAGHRVLKCGPALAEAQLSFAAISDLLATVLDDALPALAPPQRYALEVALLLQEADGSPPDVRALAGAFLGAVAYAAASSPVLLAIDDVQWLDAPSRTVLEFALRRLGAEPVRLLVSRRGTDTELPLGLGRALAPGQIELLSLPALRMGAVHRLLQARLGSTLSRPVLRQLHAASGGNPFYALELGRALQRRGFKPPPGELLPVPETLQLLVQERVSALPERVRRLLELVAAMFYRRLADVRKLAHEDRLDGAIDEAIAAGVLQLEGARLDFSHPLLASGVYAVIGPQRRRELHLRMAAEWSGDEAHALHLALAVDEPDREAADELARSAARALARGASDTAGRLAERAALLTPAEQADVRGRRTIEAADHYIVAGAPGHAHALLSELVEHMQPGLVRAQALSLLSWSFPDADLAVAARLGEQALAEGTDDPQLLAITHLRLGVIEEIRGLADASTGHRRAALGLAEQLGDPALLANALAAVGYQQTMRLARVTNESRRAVELEQSLGGFLGHASPSISLGQVLMYTDALDQARTVLQDALARAAAAGHEDARAHCVFHLADLERRAGNWDRALVLSDEARELSAQSGNEQEYASSLVVGALLDAGMGRVEQAREAAAAGLAAAERIGDQIFAIHHRGVLGFVELSVGDPQAAHEWLAPSTDALVQREVAEISIYPVIQNEIEAVVAIGALDRAERLVAHLEQLAARTGRSWTLAIAGRGRGLILAAEGELDPARASLHAALAAHDEVRQPFELARTLLIIGGLERRAKQKRASRDALERAVAIFTKLPAPLWLAKADAELARLGLRPVDGGLTETEAKIAELAAAGLTNPEIAAAAFVSRKTVEANLSKVYRKLGVRSRVELARRLPAPDEV